MKAFKKQFSKELMLVAWHPTRRRDWPVPGDERNEIDPIFTDKKWYKVGK